MPLWNGAGMTESISLPPGTAPGVWVVEQMENGVASVEINGEKIAAVPVKSLPRGVCEGDVLRVTVSRDTSAGTQVTITNDPAEKARRLARSAAQMRKGGPGGKGNITL